MRDMKFSLAHAFVFTTLVAILLTFIRMGKIYFFYFMANPEEDYSNTWEPYIMGSAVLVIWILSLSLTLFVLLAFTDGFVKGYRDARDKRNKNADNQKLSADQEPKD